MIKSIFKESNLYILLWVIYFLQGGILPQGFIISTLCGVVAMFLGIIHIFKMFTALQNDIWFRNLNKFLLLLTFYGLWSIIIYGDKHFLQTNYISILPIYSSFYFIKRGDWNETHLKILAIIFLLLTINRFYIEKEKALALFIKREECTNNIGARFVGLMPCLFLFSKERLIQMFILLIILIFILQGYKRGAILIGLISLLYFIYKSFVTSKSKKDTFIMLLFVCVIVVYGVSYVGDLLDNSAYFNQRIEQTQEGSSSGRDVLYSSLISEYIYNFNALELLFGKGADMTVQLAGNYAHQDWLELLIDCGALGVFIYILFFINSIKIIRNARYYECQGMFEMSIMILLIKSFFSMGFQSIEITSGLWLSYGYYKIYEKKYRDESLYINKQFSNY